MFYSRHINLKLVGKFVFHPSKTPMKKKAEITKSELTYFMNDPNNFRKYLQLLQAVDNGKLTERNHPLKSQKNVQLFLD